MDDLKSITASLDFLAAGLTEKGFLRTGADFRIVDSGQSAFETYVVIRYRNAAWDDPTVKVFNCDRHKTIEGVFKAAADYVAELQSVDEQKRQKLLQRASDLKAEFEAEGYHDAAAAIGGVFETIRNDLLPAPEAVAAE